MINTFWVTNGVAFGRGAEPPLTLNICTPRKVDFWVEVRTVRRDVLPLNPREEYLSFFVLFSA